MHVRAIVFCSIAAVAACELPCANAVSALDFDLTCAVVSAAEIATSVPESSEWNTALQIQIFYLGRLGGRDDRTYWAAVS
jgi:hypothetical protein